MKIKLSRNDIFVTGTCVICGEEFPPDIVMATAYSDDGRRSYGEVCPKCIYKGQTVVREHLQEQIQTLRMRAERLLDIATDLEEELSQPIELPQWTKWLKAHLKTFLHRIGMTDNETVKEFHQTVQEWTTEALDEYLAQEKDAATQDDPLQQARYALVWHEREKRQVKDNHGQDPS